MVHTYPRLLAAAQHSPFPYTMPASSCALLLAARHALAVGRAGGPFSRRHRAAPGHGGRAGPRRQRMNRSHLRAGGSLLGNARGWPPAWTCLHPLEFGCLHPTHMHASCLLCHYKIVNPACRTCASRPGMAIHRHCSHPSTRQRQMLGSEHSVLKSINAKLGVALYSCWTSRPKVPEGPQDGNCQAGGQAGSGLFRARASAGK